MRGKSHLLLGEYLAQRYMGHVPGYCVRAFLIGCVEPDRNPVTYLKGSLRHQWLRGHNYRNARRFMRTLSHRMERKEKLNVLDYYALGKLIHYTADAFTCAHNTQFPGDLEDHRMYEAALQDHFLAYLKTDPEINVKLASSIMEAIGSYHSAYSAENCGIHTDARYALNACCCVVALLLSGRIL